MIVFLGDSFTWGQGLQYIHLTEHKGWTWEECSKIIPPNTQLEWLGSDEDEYRKQNAFPYLVSKRLDLPYVVGRFENGGDNQTIFQMIENMMPFCTINNIFCLVIQFSDASRSLQHEYDESLGSIDEQIENQVKRISEHCNKNNIDWVGVSWQPEIGDILKKQYSNNYIPIIHNEIEYTNFSTRHIGLSELFLTHNYSISDQHFNLKGHNLISDMIYNKITLRKDLIDKLNQYKQQIENIRNL
jgi:hypothetical protein